METIYVTLSDGSRRPVLGVASGSDFAVLAVGGATLPAALGQATMAASLAVVIASDQSAIPTKGTRTATAALTGSASLPAAGAFEVDPTTGAMVTIPTTAKRATIYISYTRGAANGAAAHKIFVSDGTKVSQVLHPDGSYNGLNGRVSTSASAIQYAISVDLEGGETKIGIASAEVGVAGTPGSYSSEITFG